MHLKIILCLSILLIACTSGTILRQSRLEEWWKRWMNHMKKGWVQAKKIKLSGNQLAYFYSLGQHQGIEETMSFSNYKPTTSPMKTRKEFRQLSTLERTKLFDALNAMKSTMVDGMAEYDIFVALHRGVDAPAAHYGAAFLPWHREYLWRFERALQAYDPDVAIPFWDSTLDQKIPQPKDSVLWTDELLGNNDGLVTTGPFANWNAGNVQDCDGYLERLGMPAPLAHQLLFSDEDVQAVFNETSFKGIAQVPEDEWFGQFESDHGGPHIFMGGHMSDITCSPNDPIFWMHHAFIDSVWETFRQNHQTTPLELEFPTDRDCDVGGEYHAPFARMGPFSGVINIHGLSNHYTNYYYKYAPRPNICQANDDCGSPYLWCDATDNYCKSKIKIGGSCKGLSGSDPCYGSSKCVLNKCQSI